MTRLCPVNEHAAVNERCSHRANKIHIYRAFFSALKICTESSEKLVFRCPVRISMFRSSKRLLLQNFYKCWGIFLKS